MALPYGMILTKIFRHFEVSFHDEVALNPKPTDTINILTLKCLRIFKENEHCVAKTKGFDAELGPSTLPFEGGEEMDKGNDDEDATLQSHPRPSSHRPSSSTSGFSFTEDHYNLFNGLIDSLTTTADSLHHSVTGLTSLLQQVLAFQQAIQSCLDAVFPPPHPSET
ncbi:Uncharacterized protein Adt_35910 [Abeliophyllum distichum]|uniref:Uncharacterized protein n=1 Tax=Abeliophyllum distichum TaxID=126358 RepID=A0ABD1QG22_9LAMI